jgi:ABC-type glycerol-3-phosphate transport system permease component
MSQPRALSPPAALTRSTPWLSRRSARRALARAAVYLCLGGGAVLILIPLLWMLSLSFMTLEQALRFPPEWIPNPFVPIWRNMARTLETQPFGLYAVNTSRIVAFSLVGQVLSSALVAFGFARLRAPGANVLFMVLVSTIMLPYIVTMIPQFVLFKTLDWVNTPLPLIVPSFSGGAFYIFLLRQFFMTIPIEMDDAARIDGAGTFTIFWRIVVPLSKPALAAVAIFSFYNHWNDFLGPLIYLQHDSQRTLSLGLALLRDPRAIPELNTIMAWTFVVALPCILVFFFAQRYFIQGIVVSGVKG